jgi:hypothetical protein
MPPRQSIFPTHFIPDHCQYMTGFGSNDVFHGSKGLHAIRI